MNSKKVKALRKMAVALAQDEYPFVPSKTTYVSKVYKRYIPGFNAQGEEVVHEVKKVTIMLGDCQRKIYKQLKKESR